MVVTYGNLKMAKYTRITFDAHQNTNVSFIKFFEKLELSPLFFSEIIHGYLSLDLSKVVQKLLEICQVDFRGYRQSYNRLLQRKAV